MRGAIILVLLFTVGCSRSPTRDTNEHADKIIIIKSAHTLTLYHEGSVLRTYSVSLGRGPGHAKQREGDHETPEGLYVIDAKNAHSRFHRALHVSYPNAEDRRQAAAQHVAPGGDIMIHGIENGLGWLGSLQRRIDWTDGCIALTDSEIDEVWKLVPVSTPVEIKH